MGTFYLLSILLRVCVVFSYYVKTGEIYENNTNTQISIQGISWFGFESETVVLAGLDKHPIGFYFDVMAQHGINSIRIPFSEEWIYYNFEYQPDPMYLSSNPELTNKKSIEILDHIFGITKSRNMTILLDLHRLNYKSISQIWYSTDSERYTVDTFQETWIKILDRYHEHVNLIGVDILNEPHDAITYGDDNPSTDWFKFANQTIFFMNNQYKNHSWLIFVQGINWGRIFPKFNSKALLFKGKNVVYSPHTYGRSVTAAMDLNPIVLKAYWDQSFGYLKTEFDQAIVIGEWGGRTILDTVWMSLFAKYIVENNMTNNYFWSLTPNSDDVDGFLLSDWTTVDPVKKILLRNIQTGIFPYLLRRRDKQITTDLKKKST